VTIRFEIAKTYGYRDEAGKMFTFVVDQRSVHAPYIWIRNENGHVRRRHIKTYDFPGVGVVEVCSTGNLKPPMQKDRQPVCWHLRADRPEEREVLQPHMTYSGGRLSVIDALKTSSAEVATATRFHQATAFLTRFCGPGPVARETVRTMLDAIAGMTEDDMRELERIRRYLRGE
jgi:hypothetical protein